MVARVELQLSTPTAALGVLADTHVPDRKRQLDPRVGRTFREAGVVAILHAGDITGPRVLAGLEEIAPVYAVRGNRDWVALRHLPYTFHLQVLGKEIVLTHGHGRWWQYLHDRLNYLFTGYQPRVFHSRLLHTHPQADVIIFGHTHHAVQQRAEGTLLFNPGTPHRLQKDQTSPSVGLLHVSAGRGVRGEIIGLPE